MGGSPLLTVFSRYQASSANGRKDCFRTIAGACREAKLKGAHPAAAVPECEESQNGHLQNQSTAWRYCII